MTVGGRRPAVALAIASLALAGCGTALQGAASPSEVPRTGVAAPGSGAGAATSWPTAVRVSADGHVCLGRPSQDAYGFDLPGLDRRPRLGRDDLVRLVRCIGDTQRSPGQGEWQVRVEQQAGAGKAALAAALRLPDETATNQSCLAFGQVPPDLWAVDTAGRALLVRVPVDGCGHFRHEFDLALEHAGWRETGRRRLAQTVPQAAIDAGCEDRWKDMAAVEAGSAAADGSRRPAGATADLARARSAKLCVYAIDDRQTPAGSFVSGRPLRGTAWAAVVAALDAAPPPGPACTTPGTRFALLFVPGSDVTYVELDGCRRVLLPDGGMRQATPRLVELLRAA